MQGNGVSRKRWGISFVLIAAALATLAYSSCGDGTDFNLFQPVAQPMALKNDKKAKLEEVRVLLDKKKYAKALDVVEPIIDSEKEDSNEARLLYSAAKLGVAELDVWSIISDILDATSKSKSTGASLAGNGGTANSTATTTTTASNTSSSTSSSGGLDDVINALTSNVLGTGAVRQAKVDALIDALTALRNAPEPDDKKIQNTGCLFAAFLAVPTLADATEAMAATTSALAQIRDAASSGGTVCPNISLLDSAAAGVIAASANFNLVLQAAANCPFLDLDQTAAAMNTLETSLENLKTNTDKGCDAIPSCPAALPNCAALFPTCVQQALAVGTGSAKAGDGVISTCELILNCTDPTTCFM